MKAEQILRGGDPAAALAQLQDEIRKDPGDARHRIFLFQLLAVLGDWDRAASQLEVAAKLDATAVPMAQTYGHAIRGEAIRRAVFAGETAPTIFGAPEPWMAYLVEALRLVAAGAFDQAEELRAQAFEDAPATAGSLDQESFQWVADADPRLGPVLEAIVVGGYCWVPFHRIRSVRFDPPQDLRDSVWMPAQFTWANGGEAVGLVPTRYPGSEISADPMVRLARKTDWIERPGGLFVGLGQRIVVTDAAEVAVMNVRALDLHAAPESTPSPADHG